MKLLLLGFCFVFSFVGLGQQTIDSACKFKLYDHVLKDTFNTGDYYVCFLMKNNERDTIKVATWNSVLIQFFKRNGYSYDEYYKFMYDILMNNRVFNYYSGFKNKGLFFVRCNPRAENQKHIEKGIYHTIDFFTKKVILMLDSMQKF